MLKPPSDKISAETREKLLALAEFIESDTDHGFYMGASFVRGEGTKVSDLPGCGTAGCIAGHYGFMTKQAHSLWTAYAAAEKLGLTSEQRDALFYPLNDWIESCDRSKAVRVVRHFAYTGEVDWSV